MDGSMQFTQDGSVDFSNGPALKEKTGGWKAAVLVFGTEFCERLGGFGIGLNLVTYIIKELHIPGSKAPNIVTNYIGTSFLCCLIGGFVADSYLGRFMTIAIFSTIQFLGMAVLTLSASLPSLKPPQCNLGMDRSACRPARGIELVMLYTALYLMALGTGGIKSCVSAFGADQFDEYDSKEKRHMAYYFNWFFVCISSGALLAVTLLVYVQDNVGRGVGYGVCAGSMLIAIWILVAGVPSYRFKPPSGSPLTPVLQALVAALRKRKLELPSDSSLLYDGEQQVQQEKSRKRVAHTNQFGFLDKAAVKEADVDYKNGIVNPWRLCTVTRVEEVKMLLRILPIWLSTFTFWTVYAQTTTFTIEQASTLDRHLGRHFEMPPATAGVFLQASVIITVALYDRILVPSVRRFTGDPQGITTIQRMGFGLLFSVLAMMVAGLVEKHRISTARAHNMLDKPNAMLPMTVFWLLPQYFIVGVGEVFTYIGQLEFFYKECPDGMRSMGTGLSLSSISLGYFLSSFLVNTVNTVTKTRSKPGWLSSNLNRSKLYNFYWLLATLNALNFTIYLILAHWYRYKATKRISEVESFEETLGEC